MVRNRTDRERSDSEGEYGQMSGYSGWLLVAFIVVALLSR